MKVFSQLEKAQLENTTSDVGSLPKGMITYRTDTNVAKVSNGTNMLALIDESSTQTMSGKTLTQAILTGSATFAQATTPANPAAGFNRIYPKADNNWYTLSPAGIESQLIGSLVSKTIATKSASLSIPSATPTTVDFDTVVVNTNGTYNSSTGVFTATVAGTYLVVASLVYDTNTSGRRGMLFVKNGSSDAYGSFFSPAGTTGVTVVNASYLLEMAVNDTVEIQAFQDSGVALSTTADPTGNRFSIAKVA